MIWIEISSQFLDAKISTSKNMKWNKTKNQNSHDHDLVPEIISGLIEKKTLMKWEGIPSPDLIDIPVKYNTKKEQVTHKN